MTLLTGVGAGGGQPLLVLTLCWRWKPQPSPGLAFMNTILELRCAQEGSVCILKA